MGEVWASEDGGEMVGNGCTRYRMFEAGDGGEGRLLQWDEGLRL